METGSALFEARQCLFGYQFLYSLFAAWLAVGFGFCVRAIGCTMIFFGCRRRLLFPLLQKLELLPQAFDCWFNLLDIFRGFRL